MRHQLGALLRPARHARWAGGEDEALELRLPVEHVLHRQHPAPRAPEQVQAVEAERRADGGELLDEAVDAPERIVVRTVGPAAAELVVEDHRPAVGELGELLEVVVREARAAVEAEEGNALPAVVVDDVPHTAAGNVDVALAHEGAILP